MVRLHLDTDFAGDPDDACALAMLLGWAGVELVGITTVADPDGARAGYVRRLLAMAGRYDIAVASGAATSLTASAPMGGIPDHDRYWGDAPVDPWLSPSGTATDLLLRSISADATVVAIGPQTNLAQLEIDHPGTLSDVEVVAMAGWFDAVTGLPDWGPAHDWNAQCDVHAVIAVSAARPRLTLVPLSTTVGVHLTRRDLPRLEAAGPVGRLLARQAVAYCEDEAKTAIAAAYKGLPEDLLNFHHDPLTCAVAAGWGGVSYRSARLTPLVDDGIVSFAPSLTGRPAYVVDTVDAGAFTQRWLSAVEHLAARADGHQL